MKRIKFFIKLIWLASILVGLVLFFIHPEWFTKEALSQFIEQNETSILGTYLLLSLIRGIFLLPSTPFVLAGILLFPNSPWLVFSISMSGIMITALYLYFASLFLELDKLFGKVSSTKIKSLTEKINKHGFWVVLIWSFFPFVPTDLICYLAGSIKMNIGKYLTAMFLGESVLVASYILLGERFL